MPSPTTTRSGWRLAVLMVCFALVVAACGSSSEDDEELLAGASLRSDTAEELDTICFDGIDLNADLDQLELLMSADGLDEPIPLWIYRDEDDLYATAPLHPVTPGDGGTIGLQFVAGDERSEPMTLNLSGLPEAPGAWADQVETIAAALDRRAAEFGSSLEDVEELGFDQVGDELLPIKVVYAYLDDGTIDDVESQLDHPDENLSDDEKALAESIVAKLDPASLVDDEASPEPTCASDGAEASAATSREVGRPGGIASRAGSHPALIQPKAAEARGEAVLASYQSSTCRVYELDITSPSQLADAVEKGVDAKVKEGGAEQRVLEAINSITSWGEDVPVVGDLIDLIGTMFATMELWFEMDAAVYPTEFRSLEATVSEEEFNEDYTRTGRLEEARVVAASTGFNAAEAFSGIAANVANAVVDSGVGQLAGEPGDVEEKFVRWLGGKIRKAILENLMGRHGQDFLEYCPQEWSVDIAHPDYVDITGIIGLITEDKSALTYWPDVALGADAIGTDILRVRAKAEAFTGLTAQDDVSIETKRLRVIANPDIVEVEDPGTDHDITVRVENADDASLFWNTPHGSWNDSFGSTTTAMDAGGSLTRPLTTPESADAYPFVIEILSTSESGLRAGRVDSDPRVDTIEVRLRELFVTPDPGTVEVGGTLRFEARDRDGELHTVRWAATGGAIIPSESAVGQYEAGDQPGTYQVTATSVSNPDLSVTVQVEIIDECNPVGTWRIREQEFLDQVAAFGAIEMTHVSGAWYVVFEGDPEEGGTFIEDLDAWTFRSTTDAGSLLTTLSGSRFGTWAISGPNMVVDTNESSVQANLVLEGFGELPASGDEDLGGLGSSSAPFTCTANVMTVTVSDGAGSITLTADKVSD